jgi:hypothetical protein
MEIINIKYEFWNETKEANLELINGIVLVVNEYTGLIIHVR